MNFIYYIIQEVLSQKGYSDDEIRIDYIGNNIIIIIKGGKEYEFARFKKNRRNTYSN